MTTNTVLKEFRLVGVDVSFPSHLSQQTFVNIWDPVLVFVVKPLNHTEGNKSRKRKTMDATARPATIAVQELMAKLSRAPRKYNASKVVSDDDVYDLSDFFGSVDESSSFPAIEWSSEDENQSRHSSSHTTSKTELRRCHSDLARSSSRPDLKRRRDEPPASLVRSKALKSSLSNLERITGTSRTLYDFSSSDYPLIVIGDDLDCLLEKKNKPRTRSKPPSSIFCKEGADSTYYTMEASSFSVES